MCTRKEAAIESIEDRNIEEIEYLVQQSTRGLHFLFDREDIVHALTKSESEGFEFFTFETRNKVQGLLLEVIEKKTFREKRTFLKTLENVDHDLLIQAYFHLVDNTILAQTNSKH